MDIDANGVLRVDAEEARSGLTRDDPEQHILHAKSDANFAAESILNHKCSDRLYMLNSETESVVHNVFGALVLSFDSTMNAPLLSKLKDARSTAKMIEELMKLKLEDGSLMLNEELAAELQIRLDTFSDLANFLREKGLNSLASSVSQDILRLIGTGFILLSLVLQTQTSKHNTFQLLFDVEQIRLELCNHLPANMNEHVNKAIDFYQRTNQRISI